MFIQSSGLLCLYAILNSWWRFLLQKRPFISWQRTWEILSHCCVNTGLSCLIAVENNRPATIPGMERYVTLRCREESHLKTGKLASACMCHVLSLSVFAGYHWLWEISGVCYVWIREILWPNVCFLLISVMNGLLRDTGIRWSVGTESERLLSYLTDAL